MLKYKCGYLGLGVMGSAMAGHLSKAGHDVTVWNRTKSRAADWLTNAEGTAAVADTIAEACRDADFVFVCVGNDSDVREVVSAKNGAFDAMKSGAILVDHTTASADLARELNDLAHSKGLSFIDAPVSGGQSGAESGRLTVMCGGNKKSLDLVEPVIRTYSSHLAYFGSAGSGQLAKMVNQICIAGLLQGLSEGIAFAEKAGLDVNTLIDCISQGAAGSWQMTNRAMTMHQRKFDFGFALDWMRKDLGMCLEEADRIGTSLPATALIDQFYAQLQHLGMGRSDTSSLIALLDGSRS